MLTTTGNTGDLSLFVNIDSQASDTAFDCGSRTSGTNESCTVTAAAGQTLSAGLLGVTSYDGVKVVATAK